MAEISAPVVPASEKAAKKRRRVAVPTSIVVTLLGAALTVWLAPALTRQWDDRQRARDLKAVLAGDMVSSGARAIRAGALLADGRGRWDAAYGQWLEDRALTVEVRQKAYFATSTVGRWKAIVEHVRSFLIACENIALTRAQTRPGELYAFAGMEHRYQKIYGELTLLAPTPREADVAALHLASDDPLNRALGMHMVKSWTLAKVEAAADEVLSAHPSGFSTTRRDLVRDLLP